MDFVLDALLQSLTELVSLRMRPYMAPGRRPRLFVAREKLRHGDAEEDAELSADTQRVDIPFYIEFWGVRRVFCSPTQRKKRIGKHSRTTTICVHGCAFP
jgi:hypothetical protein